MPDGISVQLVGKENVVAAFRRLRELLPGDPTRKPVRSAAGFLAAELQRAIPAARGYSSGRLMGAIRVTVGRSKGATHGKINIDQRSYYWRFLELGWHAHGTKRFFKYPFIVPTTRQLQAQTGQMLLSGCEREIAKAIDRVCRASYTAGFGESFPKFW